MAAESVTKRRCELSKPQDPDFWPHRDRHVRSNLHLDPFEMQRGGSAVTLQTQEKTEKARV